MRMHNLFVSHSWNYSGQYNNLISLLRKEPYFHFRDYSVPKDDPIHRASSDKALKEAIRKQMAPCGVVLILAGVYSTYSKWIDIEIDLAQIGFVSSKPIIAIEPRGSEKTSTKVKSAADHIVNWSTKSVVNTIRDLVK